MSQNFEFAGAAPPGAWCSGPLNGRRRVALATRDVTVPRHGATSRDDQVNTSETDLVFNTPKNSWFVETFGL